MFYGKDGNYAFAFNNEEDFDVFSSQVAIDMIVEDAHNANDQDFQKALFDFIDKLEGDDNDVQ